MVKKKIFSHGFSMFKCLTNGNYYHIQQFSNVSWQIFVIFSRQQYWMIQQREEKKTVHFLFEHELNIFDGVTPISERNEQTLTFLFVHSQFSYLEIRFFQQNGFCLLAKYQ